MGLKNILKKIGGAVPLLTSVLPIPGGPALGMLAKAFLGDSKASAEEVYEKMNGDPDWLMKVRQIELENAGELQKALAEIDLAEVQGYWNYQNTQVASDDPYVRRQRPQFGYMISYCFGVQLIGTIILGFLALGLDSYMMLKGTTTVSYFTTVVDSLVALNAATTTIWGVALTVQGYNIGMRSKDKQTAVGVEPKGLLEKLIGKRGL